MTDTTDHASSTGGNAHKGRVLILVENLSVPFDRRVWQEANALKEAGYTVSIICPSMEPGEAYEEVLSGINIYRHNLRQAGGAAGYLVEYAQALFHQLRLSFRVRSRHGVDVIQACNPPDLMFLVAWVHRLFFGTRFIFDHHDLSPELFETKFGKKGMLWKAVSLAEKGTFRLADVSIATNETFKQIAVDRGGMDPDKVFVVKSYPRIEKFVRTDPNPALRALAPINVGFLGIMGEQDGVDTLVRAIAELASRGRRDIGCIIIGDGPEKERLEKLAVELGVAENVAFTGYQRGEPLMQAISALDIGIIPDIPDEFNGKLSMNKVFEYMMIGIPIVLFDLAQARSEAKEAALVVQEHSPVALADAILSLADDPERRLGMGAWGRGEAERTFRWENEVRSLLAAYECALASGRK